MSKQMHGKATRAGGSRAAMTAETTASCLFSTFNTWDVKMGGSSVSETLAPQTLSFPKHPKASAVKNGPQSRCVSCIAICYFHRSLTLVCLFKEGRGLPPWRPEPQTVDLPSTQAALVSRFCVCASRARGGFTKPDTDCLFTSWKPNE